MFRSVLSSLNSGAAAPVDSNGTAKSGDQAADDGAASSKSNVSENSLSNNNNNNNNNCSSFAKNKGGMRMMSVKRGRKKLSSMMSRLKSASSTGSSAGKQAGEGAADAHSAWDSDDEAYKSAEEACRKMSLVDNNSNPLKAAAARRVSLVRSGAKKQAVDEKQWPAEEKEDDEAEAEAEEAEEKQFILPEEQCDIPTFLQTKNCDPYLIEETRRLLKGRYAKNPDHFYDADYDRMLTDDWTVSRFLLRRRLNPKRTAKLMEECGRFRKQYKMSEVQLWEFPKEFHQAGGLFRYAPDRVGNVTMYMRVKMYRRVPEISDVFKAFILCVLEQCDVANNGRGTAVIFDLTGCGLQNVDLGFLSWLLSSFRNYCPKGVSYILVYNLPWILNATCKIAMTWMSASNKRALRFVYGDEIENFIPLANLPDYLGGACKLNYRAIPAGSRPAIEVCDRLDMTREQAIKIRELFKEYLTDCAETEAPPPPPSSFEEHNSAGKQQANTTTTTTSHTQENHDETKSHYDDAKSSASFGSLELEPPVLLNTSSSAAVAATLVNSNPNGRAQPVVELVSQASKFVAH